MTEEEYTNMTKLIRDVVLILFFFGAVHIGFFAMLLPTLVGMPSYIAVGAGVLGTILLIVVDVLALLHFSKRLFVNQGKEDSNEKG